MGMRVLESDVLGHFWPCRRIYPRRLRDGAGANEEGAGDRPRDGRARPRSGQVSAPCRRSASLGGDATAARRHLGRRVDFLASRTRKYRSVSPTRSTLPRGSRWRRATIGKAQSSAVSGRRAPRARSGNAVLPVDQTTHDACRNRCREALGEAACEAAFAAGRAMTADDAVRDALRFLGADEADDAAPVGG